MEKQLFSSLIKVLTLMATGSAEEQKGSPLWDEIEKTVEEFRAKYPDYKVDVDYKKHTDWRYKTPAKENKLLIVIEGGLVQNVMANHDVTVVKIDYDNFGHTGSEDEEEIEEVVDEMFVEPMDTNSFADTIRGENLSDHESRVKKYLIENLDTK